MRSSLLRDGNGFWSALDASLRENIRAATRVRSVPRGETLVERHSPAETLYVVDFGLFEVRDAKGRAVDEIGAEQLIGEIGFFAGNPRNASVVAVRDSQVLEIDRVTFDALSAKAPEIERAATRALAKRLASITPKAHERVRPARAPRVVVVAGAGSGVAPEAFLAALRRAVEAQPGARYVTSADLPERFVGDAVERYEEAAWLAEVERENSLVVCAADAELTPWTQTALHAADQVVLVGSGDAEGDIPWKGKPWRCSRRSAAGSWRSISAAAVSLRRPPAGSSAARPSWSITSVSTTHRTSKASCVS